MSAVRTALLLLLALPLGACTAADASSASLRDGPDLVIAPPVDGELDVPPPTPIDAGASALPEADLDDAPPSLDALDPRTRPRLRCQGESNDRCLEGERCCPTTGFCVPMDCVGCCSSDAFHRFDRRDAPDAERLPEVDPVGPTGDDEGETPARDAPADGETPGPMPPTPSA